MNAIVQLRIAGILLLLLAAANLTFPRRFGWRDELAKVSLLTRQVFFVHAGFIILTVGLFGILSLFYADALVARSPLAAPILAGLTLFWAARFVTQLLIYDARLWKGDLSRTAAHVAFSLLWLYFVAVYGGVLLQHWSA